MFDDPKDQKMLEFLDDAAHVVRKAAIRAGLEQRDRLESAIGSAPLEILEARYIQPARPDYATLAKQHRVSVKEVQVLERRGLAAIDVLLFGVTNRRPLAR